MSLIALIIVSWDARRYLRDCLNSAFQTGGALLHEIIVVDNASSDGSREMVFKEFPRVKLIHPARIACDGFRHCLRFEFWLSYAYLVSLVLLTTGSNSRRA
jgi:glycosyltransferase involved in cell wall biosynthesis